MARQDTDTEELIDRAGRQQLRGRHTRARRRGGETSWLETSSPFTRTREADR
jgi:hypothetical protein